MAVRRSSMPQSEHVVAACCSGRQGDPLPLSSLSLPLSSLSLLLPPSLSLFPPSFLAPLLSLLSPSLSPSPPLPPLSFDSPSKCTRCTLRSANFSLRLPPRCTLALHPPPSPLHLGPRPRRLWTLPAAPAPYVLRPTPYSLHADEHANVRRSTKSSSRSGSSRSRPLSAPLSCYATPAPGPAHAMLLRACYAMSSTNLPSPGTNPASPGTKLPSPGTDPGLIFPIPVQIRY
eukprot:653051-Rhodomonas_salina.2